MARVFYVLLYYITDRKQLAHSESSRQKQLLARIAAAARAGVDYIQLRERDLKFRDLEALAREAVHAVREANASSVRAQEGGTRPRARLLINSRVDLALAAGADGVHLRSNDISSSEARAIWDRWRRTAEPRSPGFVVAVSCHTSADVRMAEAHGADFAVFAPVFEKVTEPPREGSGLSALREACWGVGAPANVEGLGTSRMPVLALGGITLESARACLDAGAAGVAAIRLFQEYDIAATVLRLRALAMSQRS